MSGKTGSGSVSAKEKEKSDGEKQKEKEKLAKEKTERIEEVKDLRAYSEGLREMPVTPKTKTT